MILGVLAFYLPWRINQRELDRGQPRTAIRASAEVGAWSAYEGAQWRIVGVRRDTVPAGAAAGYQHPAAVRLLVDFEVIAGASVDVQRLDQCKGRLVDASGRTWDANMPAQLSTWMRRRGLQETCGSRVTGEPATAALGQPFAFTQAYLLPADAPTQGLQADLYFQPFSTTPKMGTYLRFALPAQHP